VGFIAGEPGLGKSQIAAYIAATVSTGGDWPFDDGTARRGDVVYITAEDGAAGTIWKFESLHPPRIILALMGTPFHFESSSGSQRAIFLLRTSHSSHRHRRLTKRGSRAIFSGDNVVFARNGPSGALFA
jgi:hypothetical protein